MLIRTVLPGGLHIDGEHFPAGTDIGTPVYALHHEETYYPQPFAFRPDRWILVKNEEGARGIASKKSLQQAFSSGPYMCFGKSLAYQQISLVAARVNWLFEMRLASDDGSDPREHPARYWMRDDGYHMLDKFFCGKGRAAFGVPAWAPPIGDRLV